VRAFNAEVPVFSQWDDHEVTNNWWPGEPLTRAEHQRKKYADPNALLLAARASRAFHEFMPLIDPLAEPGRVYRKIAYGPLLDVFMLDMRSYRGPNGEGNETSYGPAAYFLGPQQTAWLKRELLNSRATWKVIAADMPISLIVIYDGDRNWGVEAVAQGDGPPRGRELEIADLLSFIRRAGITNTVWLTADVHYTAHYYDPNKAVFQDFEPFWEFRPDSRRQLRPEPARQHVRSATRLHQGANQGAGPERGAHIWAAVLRSRGDRRRNRRDDGHPQGLGRQCRVVDEA
jgi:alkaline phosphatase D